MRKAGSALTYALIFIFLQHCATAASLDDKRLGFQHSPLRWWTQHEAHAAVSTRGLHQFLPAIASLKDGRGLFVVGLGSSIMANQAGCFYSDVAITKTLADRLPMYGQYTEEGACRHGTRTTELRCFSPSLLWPSGHVLLLLRCINH